MADREATAPRASRTQYDSYQEYLFSLDVFVHQIVFHRPLVQQMLTAPTPLSTRQGSSSDASDFRLRSALETPFGTVVGFRLWEFPLLYIQQQHSNDSIRPDDNISSSNRRPISFGSGKSCIFKMSMEQLHIYMQATPLYLYVYDYGGNVKQSLAFGDDLLPRDSPVVRMPNLIGAASISLKELTVPDSPNKVRSCR